MSRLPAAVRSELQGSTDAPEQAQVAPLFVVGSRVELGRVQQRRRHARARRQADSIPLGHLLDVLLLEDLERAGRMCLLTASRFNVGLLAWAGCRGGGGLAPGSSDGVAAASGTCRTPSHESQPWAAAEGERGQTDCIGDSVTGPVVGLSSGCLVGPELIEGES